MLPPLAPADSRCSCCLHFHQLIVRHRRRMLTWDGNVCAQLLPCMPMYWFELLVSMKLVDHTPGTVTMPSIWIWWILTLPRIYIRATRLYQYFQKMELRVRFPGDKLQVGVTTCFQPRDFRL